MAKVAKITISVPNEMLEVVEREREAKGETRSEFIVRAVEDYLRRERERQDDEDYIRGYQQFPESEDEELTAWVQGAQLGLAQVFRDEEPWPEHDYEASHSQDAPR